MHILKIIFSPFVAVFKFINTYFKTCVFLFIVFLIFSGGEVKPTPNLAQINLKGTILEDKAILDRIYTVMRDPNIKGVFLDVDSPGGGLAQSVAISDAIKELASKKPVVAYASGTMASGSYYASIWATKIYSNRASFIGSIGVIMQGINIEELTNKIGVKTQTIKAGKYKEAGTFSRKWNDDEKNELQGLVDKSYDLFCTDVSKARKLDLAKKDTWANARVFLATDALKLGLIDGVMSYYDAQHELFKMTGVMNPIWQTQPFMDQIISKISKESANLLFGTFFGELR